MRGWELLVCEEPLLHPPSLPFLQVSSELLHNLGGWGVPGQGSPETSPLVMALETSVG